MYIAKDRKLKEKVPWYVKVYGLRNAKLVNQFSQNLLTSTFFQGKPVNLINLSNINVETIIVSLFMSE